MNGAVECPQIHSGSARTAPRPAGRPFDFNKVVNFEAKLINSLNCGRRYSVLNAQSNLEPVEGTFWIAGFDQFYYGRWIE
jgi:hypothetical protein